MITVSVTSDSNERELRAASRLIDDLLSFRAEEHLSKTADMLIDNDVASTYTHDAIKEIERVRDDIQKDIDNFYVNGTSKLEPRGIFTAEELDAMEANDQTTREYFSKSELAEAEELGKPVCSTVDAAASLTAHADTTVNTSLPEPTSVFGQPAQTTANVANPAVPLSERPVLAGDLDADGLLWDKRIHSSSKELNKDGTWRKRRGVADELVAEVERELRGVAPTPAPPPVPEAPKPIEVPPTVGDMTFTELLDGVTKAMVAGQLSQATIAEALKSVGLEALPHLLGNPALIPAFRKALGGVV